MSILSKKKGMLDRLEKEKKEKDAKLERERLQKEKLDKVAKQRLLRVSIIGIPNTGKR